MERPTDFSKVEKGWHKVQIIHNGRYPNDRYLIWDGSTFRGPNNRDYVQLFGWERLEDLGKTDEIEELKSFNSYEQEEE